jgi:hypothetical protein
VGEQVLGDAAAGAGGADVAAHLEVGDADAVAAALGEEGDLVDLEPDLRGVPGLAGRLEAGQGGLGLGGVAAVLGGLLAVIVVGAELVAEALELLGEGGVVAEEQGLFEGDDGGAEVLGLEGGGGLVDEGGLAGGGVVGGGGDDGVGLVLQPGEVVGAVAVAVLLEGGGGEAGASSALPSSSTARTSSTARSARAFVSRRDLSRAISRATESVLRTFWASS